MSKLKAVTDFFIWLLFVSTALATVLLIGLHIYYLLTLQTWYAALPLLTAIITGLMHAGLRFLPDKS